MWHWVAQNKEWLFSGAGITLLVVLLWFVKKLLRTDKPAAGTVRASSSVSNVVTAQGVNINVSPNISPVISPIMSPTGSNAYEVAQRALKRQDERILSNVGCLRPEVTTVLVDEESDVWSKGSGEGLLAVLLPFSNEPQPGKKTLSVQSLKARLTYYQRDRVEEFKRIDSGCWLKEAYNSIYLDVGGIVYLIAAVQGEGYTFAVANPRYSAARYSQDRTSGEHLPAGIYELKVGLTSGDYGELAETYWFRLEVGDQLKAVRLNPRLPGGP
jgi:hypothetical protein